MSLLISNHLKKGYSDYNLFFLKHYYQELNLNNKILDVGCGHYRNLYLFYKIGFKNLYGIDRAVPNPNINNKKFKVNFIQKDIMQGLPYKEKLFDIVLCNYVLMFISPDKLYYVLQELLRVTKVILVIETQSQFYEAKNTEIRHYDFKNIVGFIESTEEFEIIHKRIYKEKLILRRKASKWLEEGNHQELKL